MLLDLIKEDQPMGSLLTNLDPNTNTNAPDPGAIGRVQPIATWPMASDPNVHTVTQPSRHI